METAVETPNITEPQTLEQTVPDGAPIVATDATTNGIAAEVEPNTITLGVPVTEDNTTSINLSNPNNGKKKGKKQNTEDYKDDYVYFWDETSSEDEQADKDDDEYVEGGELMEEEDIDENVGTDDDDFEPTTRSKKRSVSSVAGNLIEKKTSRGNTSSTSTRKNKTAKTKETASPTQQKITSNSTTIPSSSSPSQLKNQPSPTPLRAGVEYPTVEVYEKDDSYLVVIKAPGIDRTALQAKISVLTLEISGSYKMPEKLQTKDPKAKEWFNRKWHKQITFPSPICVDQRSGLVELSVEGVIFYWCTKQSKETMVVPKTVIL